MRISKRVVLAAGFTFVAIIGLGTIAILNRQTQYDPTFNTIIDTPVYSQLGPVVLFDEGHLNTHTATDGYKPFADLVRNDGYRWNTVRGRFTREILESASILVVVLPRGSNDSNDDPAFSDEECSTVAEWVREGGSLLLITDHWPYGASAATLGEQFQIKMSAGMTEDPKHCDDELGDSHIVFSKANGLLGTHPITMGRTQSEQLNRVLTFTGQSIQGPHDAIPFLLLSDDAIDRPPAAPVVRKTDGNIQVEMQYGSPVPANGKAQGLALEVEKGRIVVLAEAGMLRAKRERNGRLVGMNRLDYDNRQLALNIVHWLSRLL
jgi:hypothetical protein